MNFSWLREKKELNISERAPALPVLPEAAPQGERLAPPQGERLASSSMEPAAALNTSLDLIGLRNEALRQKIEDVEYGFSAVDALRDSYRQLIAPMAEMLGELETAKAGLHETRVKYGMLQEAHNTLKTRHIAVACEAEVVSRALEAVNHESRDLRQWLHQSETGLETANSELRERASNIERLERQLESATRGGEALEAESKRMKQEVEDRDARLAQSESQLKAMGDANAMLKHELTAARADSAEIAANFEARNRRLTEIEPLYEHSQRRVVELEAALTSAQTALSASEAQRIEEIERHRREFSTAHHTIEALRGRGEITEKLLADTRNQLRGKVEELRAAERQLLEGRMLNDSLDKKHRAACEDLAKAEQRIAGMDEMRATLVDRLNVLVKAVQAKESAAGAAEQKVEELTRRHDEAQQRAQRDRDRAERDLAELREMLERERAERILVEGALQASRQGRARRGQGAAAPHAEGHGHRPETASPPAAPEAGDPPGFDPTREPNLRVMTP